MVFVIMDMNMSDESDFNSVILPTKLEVCEGGSLSPMKSPSTSFSESPLHAAEGCIIQAIMLSYWDNILGPKIQHLWYNPYEAVLSRNILCHISSHTLNGEICRDLSECNIDNKICFISEENLIVTAFIFGAMSKTGMSVFSLSIITPMNYKKMYLSWHELCVTWMTRIIGKLRILLDKDVENSYIKEFSSHIKAVVIMLKSLKNQGMQDQLSLFNTVFHPDHQLVLPFHQDQKMALLFVHRAIASHLMTCRRSLVIGTSLSKVNMLICTLALFLSPDERLCSRYATPEITYHPDLCVQGVLKSLDNSQSLSMCLKETLYSRYPTTLLDVDTLDVRQSPPMHLHVQKRYEIMRKELCQLWLGQQVADIYPASEMFSQFEETESVVKNFLEEVFQLYPACGVRETYIDQFMRLIDKKALSLIKYTEAETQHGRNCHKGSIKKLCNDLSLNVTGDFRIVLAAAELLKPGLYDFLSGDQKVSDSEFQHLLATF